MCKSKKYLALTLILVLCVALLCACSKTGQYFIFGTFIEISLEGKESSKKLSEIEKELERLEGLFAVNIQDSEVDKVNNAKAGEKVQISEEFCDILKVCQEVYEKSDGMFDITVLPLVKLWGFAASNYNGYAPETPILIEDIERVLEYVGFDKLKIDYDNKTIEKLYSRVRIDVGAVAKGYAVGRSYAICAGSKALINIGGNIGASAENYKIGVANPRDNNASYFGSFSLNAGETVASSGDYERFYEKDGVRYCHIINPKTGMPAGVSYDVKTKKYANTASNLIAVTIISSGNFAMCDAVSTAVLLLGKEAGGALVSKLDLKAVLIDNDLNYNLIGDFEFALK